MGITRPETLVQEALAPEKMAEAQHTAMGTRTRSPCPALALQNAPQTDAIHEDRARAFQKEKTSCQGRPMKAHALPCLKPLMICTLPRSPFTTTRRDALLLPRSWTTLLLALLPHHCCHSATTTLLCTTTACCVYADDATLLLPRCCYLAILASNTPTKQNKAINQAVPSTSKLRPANPQRLA